jgi:ABC-type dipeptide/oligopeptide/nickel transport system permease component
MIREGLPISVALGGYATVIGAAVGLGLGVAAALRRNSWTDHTASIVSVLGVAVPSYVVGMLLVIGFSLKLRWLPAGGWTGPESWVLPVLALAAEPIAVISRYARMSVLDVLGEAHVTVARAKGLLEARVLFRHVIRNALIPVVTAFGLVAPRLVVGSFLVETVFAVPGSGRLFVAAVTRRDYPVIMAVALLYASVVVVANVVVDIAYHWLDPRIRYA